MGRENPKLKKKKGLKYISNEYHMYPEGGKERKGRRIQVVHEHNTRLYMLSLDTGKILGGGGGELQMTLNSLSYNKRF